MATLSLEQLREKMPHFTARMDTATRGQRRDELAGWQERAQSHIKDVITRNRPPGNPIVFARKSFVERALPLLADRRGDEDAQHILNHLDYIKSLMQE